MYGEVGVISFFGLNKKYYQFYFFMLYIGSFPCIKPCSLFKFLVQQKLEFLSTVKLYQILKYK